MLKKNVNYEDFDGNAAVDTLYFNLTKTELQENDTLLERFQRIGDSLQGEPRQLTTDEIKQILDLVKEVIRISYGIKSADGKRFIKSEEQWIEFKQTAVYDAFLFSLFENPESANEFLYGVFPKDLVEEAQKQVAIQQGVENPDPVVAQIPTAPELETPKEKTFEDYTRAELLEMPQEKFEQLVGRDANKMTKEQLTIAFQRKSQA